MQEQKLQLDLTIKTSSNEVLDEKSIALALLRMETAFNSLPTLFRIHIGEYKLVKGE